MLDRREEYQQTVRDAFKNYEALTKFLDYELKRIIGRRHSPNQNDPLNIEAQKDWAVVEYINHLGALCEMVKQKKEIPNGRFKSTITTKSEQL